MYAKLAVLALFVAAASAESCDGCTRKALKEWMAGEETAAYWCENAYVAIGMDMCFHNGSCGKDATQLESAAKPFCAPIRKSVGCAAGGGRDSKNCQKKVSLADHA